MYSIISKIFPNLTPSTSNLTKFTQGLISIECDNDIIFIEISYIKFPYNIISSLQKDLSKLFSQKNIQITILENTTHDFTISEKYSLSYIIEHSPIVLTFSITSLVYFAKKLQFISNNYHASTIHDLYQELYRFQPQLLDPKIWLNLSDQELELLFNHMLHNKLVTLPMLALFFQEITLSSPLNFFSHRITKELQKEICTLPQVISPILLHAVYYIIERNIILLLSEKNIPSLTEYYQKNISYQKYFYQNSLSQLRLTQLYFCRNTYFNNSTISLNKIPYFSLVVFLKFSPQENLNFFQQFFSQDGFLRLTSDIHYNNHSILECYSMMKYIAYLEYKTRNLSFSQLILKFIKKPRDWELLARECNLQELLLAIDTLDHHEQKTLHGIIFSIYQCYYNKSLIFPNIIKIPINQALQNCSINIIFLAISNKLSINYKYMN